MAYQALSLSQAAKYDHDTKQKEKLTGWGKVCKDREARKVSRKARREQRENQDVQV
jgi:hypothetical protein